MATFPYGKYDEMTESECVPSEPTHADEHALELGTEPTQSTEPTEPTEPIEPTEPTE